ncbi:AAA family ATPase [Actinosynnema sp. NPDC047251]|uniref:Transcriptional regulator, LuxR family, fused with ATPase domain n=1 Tax=Saccharothrix espanaensis (strain ATCC 51144 / DSM 44229 / JCM 9112 / NBRC 15066 / NRRL 15764) TaxID=1179773 RepID=K0KBN7_SACES|nr:LuxR family transcriptional regulator [Saccharothrix espanaensis]CCH34043.1 Transcriptional regulator, LuxR family, fused with ATPase domain [Saccharothrix espanaensis DSM 44229]
MPPVARLGTGIPLVARSREMTRLRAALDEAARGKAGAVLLAGDAGVGKTRLVEELAAAADALVLTGRCLDVGETGLPYLPFTEVLGQVREAGLLDVEARPALGRLLPELSLPASQDSGLSGLPSHLVGRRPEQDVGQLQLFDAVHGLLGELAESRPVLLVLEDLHWADASTRYLLSFLLSRLRAQRLLIVSSYRSDDLHRSHPLRPLLTELVRLPAVQRLDLTPFSAIDARSFVAALSDDLPDDLVLEVAERSDGNPFFAEELIAVATCGSGIPWTLAEVLLARIERLSPPAQHVVRVASVGGRSVRHDLLRHVADMDDAALDAALREAVQHHVLVVNGTEIFTFRHALLREAVYGDLLPGERVRLHAAYASRIADQSDRGSAAALAHHSLESHDLARALRASVDAAQEAQAAGAPAEALRHLEQALKVWQAVPAADRPAGVTELLLLRRASWVAGTAGQPERAIAFARSGTALVDAEAPEEAAEMWRRFAQALQVIDGTEAEKFVAIEEAWKLVRDRPASPSRAWVLAVWAALLRQDREYAEARERAQDAVRDGRESGADAAVADALATLGLLDEAAADVASARAHLEEAVAFATEVDAVNTELRARYFLGLHHYDLGELADAARVFDEGMARAKETGLSWSSYGLELRILQVLTRYYVGEWEGAAVAAEPPGLRVSSTVSARLAASGTHVLVSRGEFEQAERLIGELRADWHRDLQIALITGGTGAELALWRGQPELAVDRVADAIAWSRREGGDWALAGIRLAALGVAGYAEIAARARRRRDKEGEEAAVAAGRDLADYARTTAEMGSPRTGSLGPEGRAWLARVAAEEGRLRGSSDADLWRVAVDEFDFGSVFEQAVCRWRLAEALLSAERRDDAVAELRLADEVADRLGAAPLRDAVHLVARRARVALHAETARTQVDPFTPRERSVLALVALGRTNREVGEELFISEKTVSVHLTRIMAKLGASRRAEAVAIAFDRGLLDQA